MSKAIIPGVYNRKKWQPPIRGRDNVPDMEIQDTLDTQDALLLGAPSGAPRGWPWVRPAASFNMKMTGLWFVRLETCYWPATGQLTERKRT